MRRLNPRDRYLDDVSFFPALHRERSLFTKEFLEGAGRLPDPLQQWQRYYDDAPASDGLSRLMYLDTKTYLTADILTKVDRMSMATSLEVRVPMLDHEFVEWVAALPLEWKYRAGTRKYHPEEAGGTPGNSFRAVASPEAGLPVASGRVDAERDEGSVFACAARAAHFAARILQAGSGPHADRRACAGTAQSFGAAVEDAGAGTVAPQFHGVAGKLGGATSGASNRNGHERA